MPTVYIRVWRCPVAPLVGAWIEISHGIIYLKRTNVAPLVGAWIEIKMHQNCVRLSFVAPLVGAWIEILRFPVSMKLIWSLSSWERGLKLLYEAIDALIQQVAPLVGAWIEIYTSKSNFESTGGRSPRGSVD